jgi:hypothetical protein
MGEGRITTTEKGAITENTSQSSKSELTRGNDAGFKKIMWE